MMKKNKFSIVAVIRVESCTGKIVELFLCTYTNASKHIHPQRCDYILYLIQFYSAATAAGSTAIYAF